MTTILENVSNLKAAYFVTAIAINSYIGLFIGLIFAPALSNVEKILATKCLMQQPLSIDELDTVWHIPRGHNGEGVDCKVINDHKLNGSEVSSDTNITLNHLVFAFQAPLPKDGILRDYSRWMMTISAMLMFDILYMEQNPMSENPKITFEVKLGYRNKGDPNDQWTLLANSIETRELECDIDNDKDKKTYGYLYDCDRLQLFELGNVYHDYYLINIRVPIDFSGKTPLNDEIGHIKNMSILIVHQNTGFVQASVFLKTFYFPVVVLFLIWYWRRISQLCRAPVLVERLLLIHGIVLSFLNLPLEYLILWIDIPFMPLFNDIRKVIFYTSQFSFWLVMCGEYLRGEIDCNRLRSYWKKITLVALGFFGSFIFDIYERSAQLKNPFYSTCASTVGSMLYVASSVIAALFGTVYIIFLFYLIFKVLQNVGVKMSNKPIMSYGKRMFYKYVIMRFKYLLQLTALFGLLLVTSIVLYERVGEGTRQWNGMSGASGFYACIYCLINLYTITLLTIYAPSRHKYRPRIPAMVMYAEDPVPRRTLTLTSACSVTPEMQSPCSSNLSPDQVPITFVSTLGGNAVGIVDANTDLWDPENENHQIYPTQEVYIISTASKIVQTEVIEVP